MDNIENISEANAARLVDGRRFYPVDMTNEELDKVIYSILKSTGMGSGAHYQVFLRKDKSSKGLDVRIQNTKSMYARRRLVTFGINPHWEVVDIFLHENVKIINPRFKTIDVFESGKEGQYGSLEIPELNSIYIERLKTKEFPYKNSLFNKDEWVCIKEKQDALADQPY